MKAKYSLVSNLCKILNLTTILKMKTLQTVKNSGFVGFASCQQNIQVKKMKSRTNKVITCFVLFTYTQSFTIVLTSAVNFHAVEVILESNFPKN